MRRLILAVPPDEGGRIRLRGKDGRYLSRVLRLGPGDSFRVLLPDGREAQASVLSAGKDIVEAAVAREADAAASLVADRKRKAATVRTPPIVLLQALPKGQKMDLIVRQATEAGVAVIIPFVSDHSVSRPEEADASRKKERWERIAKEARQQSGSDVPTEILAPRGLREALDAALGRNPRPASAHAAAPVAAGAVVEDDPLPTLRAAVARTGAREVVVLTHPHALEDTFHQDWAARAREELRGPVLHVYLGTSRLG